MTSGAIASVDMRPSGFPDRLSLIASGNPVYRKQYQPAPLEKTDKMLCSAICLA